MDEFVVRFAYKQAVRRHQSYVTHQTCLDTIKKACIESVREEEKQRSRLIR